MKATIDDEEQAAAYLRAVEIKLTEERQRKYEVDTLAAKLAAVMAAKDEACDLAMCLCHGGESLPLYRKLTELRAVGADK